MADDNQWKEHSSLGCSPVPFLSPLIKSSMGGISIPVNLKTLAKGLYPPSLNFLSFNWESCILILSTNVLSFGIPNKWP
uniref:Uncharacterized protein n=1 Tax=Tanacetum cinerariifolium TaxID=118510 RepID=A0A699SG70_TANCI|nr:hypothetical protein [Tanacetum cinerariifolium]